MIRNRESDDFINADKSAAHAAIEAAHPGTGIAGILFEQRRLFHRAAHFPEADNFESIAKAAAEFPFGTGATRGQE
jgi:hypothetical protein